MNEMDRPRKILRPKEVQALIGKSRVQIWRDVRAGKFSPPVVLGTNSIGWYEDEIADWLKSRPRRTYGAETPAKTDAAA